MRKVALVTGEIYHIITRSIAGFKVFNTKVDFQRIIDVIQFYNCQDIKMKFSNFLSLSPKKQHKIRIEFISDHRQRLVRIIAYSIMPTHIHLLLKQLSDNGISQYMKNLLDSYSKYFNIKHKRKGPLWESRFKNVLIDTEEQLLHLTRYIHLNPATAHLVERPEDWEYSSYSEYLQQENKRGICDFKEFLEMDGKEYQGFVNDRIDYQQQLAKIKNLLIENLDQ